MTRAQPADRPKQRSVHFVWGNFPLAALCSLKTRREFLTVARTGRRSVRPGLILQAGRKHGGNALPEDAGPRVGFTVSRKVGNAVQRNLVKRRFRELSRAVLAEKGDPAYDYVLVGRRAAVKRPYSLLRSDLERALKDLGLEKTK